MNHRLQNAMSVSIDTGNTMHLPWSAELERELCASCEASDGDTYEGHPTSDEDREPIRWQTWRIRLARRAA